MFIESPAGRTFVRPEAVAAVTADGNQVSVYLNGGTRLAWSAHRDQAAATDAAAELLAQLGPDIKQVARQTSSKEKTK